VDRQSDDVIGSDRHLQGRPEGSLGPGTHWIPPPQSSRRHDAWALLGIPLGLVLASATAVLILGVWEQCEIPGNAGDRFGLLWLVGPALAITIMISFALVIRLVGSRSLAAAVFFGVAIGLALCYIAVYVVATPEAMGCGPNSLPTWWPSWLPTAHGLPILP